MFKSIINRFKCQEESNVSYSIDIKKKSHIIDGYDREYFWAILRNSDGCSTVYTCGWSNTSKDAWKEANEAYERIVNNGGVGWFGN